MRWVLGMLLGGRRRPVIVVECRHCGTTLSLNTACCPECDSESIATYEIG